MAALSPSHSHLGESHAHRLKRHRRVDPPFHQVCTGEPFGLNPELARRPLESVPRRARDGTDPALSTPVHRALTAASKPSYGDPRSAACCPWGLGSDGRL